MDLSGFYFFFIIFLPHYLFFERAALAQIRVEKSAKNLSEIVQYANCTCGYYLSIEIDPNKTWQCRIFIAFVKFAILDSELFKKQYCVGV